ncbi:hypothetical protein ACFQ3S_03520 [Mucilaginibacter terrae]|uniref:hypothetical protein n=1 Tax=Mucilaginibacter terrae TaxID=1955052 RepID=UPI003644038C
MSFKTTIAIIITIGLTILIMQNQGEAEFTILFASVKLPKLVMLTAVSVSAFLLGLLVSRPGRTKQPERYHEYDDEEENDDDRPRRRPDTLSDEDRDYIS